MADKMFRVKLTCKKGNKKNGTHESERLYMFGFF